MDASIYALVDSRNPEDYRYVGKTTGSVAYRLRKHRTPRKREAHFHKSRWVNCVISSGGRIDAVVLETCAAENANERERYWIARCRDEGYRLTNMTEGGDGVVVCLPEVREKISRSLKGRKRSASSVAKMAETNRGRKYSPATRKKMSDSQKGRTKTVDVRRKIAEASRRVSKITQEDVGDIKRRVSEGETQTSVARHLGISTSMVNMIVSGKRRGVIT